MTGIINIIRRIEKLLCNATHDATVGPHFTLDERRLKERVAEVGSASSTAALRCRALLKPDRRTPTFSHSAADFICDAFAHLPHPFFNFFMPPLHNSRSTIVFCRLDFVFFTRFVEVLRRVVARYVRTTYCSFSFPWYTTYILLTNLYELILRNARVPENTFALLRDNVALKVFLVRAIILLVVCIEGNLH